MSANRINIIGQRFGRLIALAEAENYVSPKGAIHLRSLCRCECGNESTIANQRLIRGETKSCGCLWHDKMRVARWKHGHAHEHAKTKIYRTWNHIIRRCENPKTRNFYRYGGRGIKVCDRWMNSFADFLADMGEGKKGWSIERVNNDGNYEPMNCIWATPTRQARNTSRNRIVTVRGITACVSELVEKFGGSYGTILYRLNKGWSPDRAFFYPIQAHTC